MAAKERSPYCKCLYFSANALARSITQLAEEAFAPTGLGPSYVFVLMALVRRPGISASELAETLQLKPSTVTRLLDNLEQRLLLTRKLVGRSITVQSTAKGEKLAEQANTAWRQLYERYVALLGEPQARLLTEQAYAAHEILSGIRSVKKQGKKKGEKQDGK
jgi:DNA-binding MarR family transcriptional regulator